MSGGLYFSCGSHC